MCWIEEHTLSTRGTECRRLLSTGYLEEYPVWLPLIAPGLIFYKIMEIRKNISHLNNVWIREYL